MDIAVITGVQLKLVAKLSRIYQVDFNRDLASGLIVSIIGNSGTVSLEQALVGSMLKIIPAIGTATGVIVIPVAAGAATYAVGQLFVQHFETGGTLLTFDSKKAHEHYELLFQQGQKVVADMKEKVPSLLKQKVVTEEVEPEAKASKT